MERFIPYDKMSRKEQKKINAEKRRDWEGLNPVTRVVTDNKKAYKRNPKHRNSIYSE